MTVRLDTSPVPCVKDILQTVIDVNERQTRLAIGGDI